MELDIVSGPGKRDIFVNLDDSFTISNGVGKLQGNIRITPLGGIARPFIWGGAGPSVKGTIIEASGDNEVNVAGADTIDPMGVVYSDGVLPGELCYVVFTGVAEVLMKDGEGATAGLWMGTNDVAGRARCQVNPGAVGLHSQEIGHCLLTVGAGINVLTRVNLHFN